MKILPILVSLFVLVMLAKLFKQRRDHKLSTMSLIAWLILWLVVLLVFWQPEITSSLALMLGVQRGADLVIYLAIIVMLYLLYRIFVRLNKIEEDISKVVRSEAIKNVRDESTR